MARVTYTGGGRGHGPEIARKDPTTRGWVVFRLGKSSECSEALAAILATETGFSVERPAAKPTTPKSKDAPADPAPGGEHA